MYEHRFRCAGARQPGKEVQVKIGDPAVLLSHENHLQRCGALLVRGWMSCSMSSRFMTRGC